MATKDKPHLHRAVYLPIVRGVPPHALGVFDFADASIVCGQRSSTSVPAQSLFLLNDEFVQSQADAFAARVSRAGGTIEDQAVRGFILALSRKPDPGERQAIRDFLSRFAALSSRPEPMSVLSAYCHSLLVCGEFRYLN